MIRSIFAGLGLALLSGCSVVGIRSGTEQPDYALLAKPADDIEIRRYENRVAAEVTLAGPADAMRDRAFRVLANYIFGGNRTSARIDMTAPVETQEAGSETIAMTAPVETQPDQDGMYRMRFFLPATYSLESAPVPLDERVTLVDLPAETYAVMRFSGSRAPARLEAEKRTLRNRLETSRWQPNGEAVAWLYDPPWTLPFVRRNEVAVPVAPKH